MQLAWAYSNRAHLCYLADDVVGDSAWGERAITLAQQLDERKVLVHAMNNVGSARGYTGDREAVALLQQSLALAREAELEDHVGRARVNLGAVLVRLYRATPKATSTRRPSLMRPRTTST